MNLIYSLPEEIQTKIWQYDTTYRDKLKVSLLELEFYTPFWKSKNSIHHLAGFHGYENYHSHCKMISHVINICGLEDKRLTLNTLHVPAFLCDYISRYDLIFNSIRSKKSIVKKHSSSRHSSAFLEEWLKKILKYT